MRRVAKQIIYGIIFVAVIALIVWGVYAFMFAPAQSCFDGRQNQGEVGVDCGGPCVSCDIKNLQDIQVSDSHIFPASDGVGVVIELHNPNVSWGARSFDYTITLKNELGNDVKTLTGSSYIYSGELKYIIEPYISQSVQHITSASMAITNVQWVSIEQMKKPHIEVLDTKTYKDKFMYVSGRIENKDSTDYGPVSVKALLYSHDGTLLAASQTSVDTLSAFDSANFSVPFSKDLALYQVTLDISTYFPNDLAPGDSGSNVNTLQIFLAEVGILQRDPTGFYDEATKQGVAILQQQLGLEPTGVFDSQIRQTIISSIASGSAQLAKGQESDRVDPAKTVIVVEAR